MRMKATLPAILAAVSILTACNGLDGRGDGDDNRFSAFTDLPGEGWFYTDHLEFVPDTLRDSLVSRGTMLISVRHGKDYLYRNLWLEISYADTDSTRRADTLNIELADAMGRWRGRGMGLSMEVLDTVPGPFPLAEHRAVKVRHIMRSDTLTGIERIGVVYVPNE